MADFWKLAFGVGGAVGLGALAWYYLSDGEIDLAPSDLPGDPGVEMTLAQDTAMPYRVRQWAGIATQAAAATAPTEVGQEQWTRLLLAIFDHESNGNPSVIGDGGKAFGLGQINVRFWPEFAKLPDAQKLDPLTNATFTGRVLRKAYDHWSSRLPTLQDAIYAAVASYNAGVGNVQKAIDAGLPPDAYTTKTAGIGYGTDVIARYTKAGGEVFS